MKSNTSFEAKSRQGNSPAKKHGLTNSLVLQKDSVAEYMNTSTPHACNKKSEATYYKHSKEIVNEEVDYDEDNEIKLMENSDSQG